MAAIAPWACITRGVRRIATVATLIVAAACVVLGYRFFIFVITLYGT